MKLNEPTGVYSNSRTTKLNHIKTPMPPCFYIPTPSKFKVHRWDRQGYSYTKCKSTATVKRVHLCVSVFVEYLRLERLTTIPATRWTIGTKNWSTLFPSAYPLNAMTIEKVWIVTNARAMSAVKYKTKLSDK